MSKDTSKKISKTLIFCGTILIAISLALTSYNLYDEHRAGESVSEVLAEIQAQEATEPTTFEQIRPDYEINPQMKMPIKTIDWVDYVGTVKIPALDLTLPVTNEWSYDLLKVAPCRYSGSPYTNDMVIAAHNYRSHFASIDELKQGDEVIFTDNDKNIFEYQVVELEILKPTDIEDMKTADDWDLTLFTCNYGGSVRITIRCEKI